MMEPLNELTESEVEAWIHNAITDAIDYIDLEESPHRSEAERYYLGHKFADSSHNPTETPGRSAYVAREVFDAVHMILPSVHRILFSADTPVEFVPRNVDDIPAAKQATEYCAYLLRDKNPGYEILDAVIKDALIKGVGVMQCWYEEKVVSKVRELTGLDQGTAAAIAQSGWQIQDMQQAEDGTISMSISQEQKDGSVMMEAVPPEEFLISRNAVSLETAKIVGRRQRVKVSDLVELGYDYQLMVDYSEVDDNFRSNEEWMLRHPTWREEESIADTDPASREVLYVEAYIRADFDGDGKAELRKICTVGGAHKVVRNVVVDDHPFVVWRMDMMQHHWSGLSIYDTVGDIQRVKSACMRNILDSLALATTPRLGFVEGNVSYEDISNDEVGALIPMRAAGSIQLLEIPFVGQNALPIIDLLDKIVQRRTGLTDAAQGMDSANLQSSTAVAVESQVKAAAARLELIVRNLVESGLRPLFVKMLRLITYHQEQQDLMLLRGEYIPVDPTGWPLMDVRVSLPIGAADTAQKTQLMMQIMAKQEQFLTQMGPDNPYCNLANYHAAQMKVMELNGVVEAQSYWKDPQQALQELQQQQQQAAQQPPPKSPEQLLSEAQVETKRMDVLAKAQKDAREDDRLRDQMAIDLFLAAQELMQKYPGMQLDMNGLVQELQRNRELDIIENRTNAERYQQALNSIGMQMNQGQMQPPPPAPNMLQ